MNKSNNYQIITITILLIKVYFICIALIFLFFKTTFGPDDTDFFKMGRIARDRPTSTGPDLDPESDPQPQPPPASQRQRLPILPRLLALAHIRLLMYSFASLQKSK